MVEEIDKSIGPLQSFIFFKCTQVICRTQFFTCIYAVMQLAQTVHEVTVGKVVSFSHYDVAGERKYCSLHE